MIFDLIEYYNARDWFNFISGVFVLLGIIYFMICGFIYNCKLINKIVPEERSK